MYKFKIVVLILVTALMAGCSAGMQTLPPAPTEPTFDLPYEMIRDDDGWYLLLEDGVVKEDESEGSFSEEGAHIVFGSMEEMVQDIKTGNFTEDELRELSEFQKDEDNRIILCDLSKVYDVYAPEEFDRKKITWLGDAYNFALACSEREIECYMYEGFSDEIKEEFIEEIITCHRVPNFTLLSTEQIEERNATVITFMSSNYGPAEERKRVYYTIEEGNKELFVAEYYGLSTDTVPSSVTIYGTENGRNYFVGLKDLQERPSVEYLMGFGFREYVETEVA